MLPAMASPASASRRGTAQPPCSNPPRKSSSGRPGACMTPSRETFSTAISFFTIPPRSIRTGLRRSTKALNNGPIHVVLPECDRVSSRSPLRRFSRRERPRRNKPPAPQLLLLPLLPRQLRLLGPLGSPCSGSAYPRRILEPCSRRSPRQLDDHRSLQFFSFMEVMA